MKKEVFLKLFCIEESIVESIKFEENNLIIKIKVSVNSFAMGNNIRENEYSDVENIYTFKNISSLSSLDIYNITNIYQTSSVDDIVCFDTNIGLIYFDFEEVIIK